MPRPLLLLVILFVVLATILASAQTAPIPSQITAAQKVFITNGGEDSVFSALFKERPYDSFYTSMKGWDRFQIVASPFDADLVLEVSDVVAAGTAKVIKGDTVGWPSDPLVKLLVIDPKTRTVLWGYSQHVDMALLQGNRDKNLKEAMTALLNNLKALTTTAKP